MVTTTCAVATQGANWPVALNVSVAPPAVTSAGDGVQVAFAALVGFEKVPEPETDQVPPVAAPPTEPPNAAVIWPAQSV